MIGQSRDTTVQMAESSSSSRIRTVQSTESPKEVEMLRVPKETSTMSGAAKRTDALGTIQTSGRFETTQESIPDNSIPEICVSDFVETFDGAISYCAEVRVNNELLHDFEWNDEFMQLVKRFHHHYKSLSLVHE